MALRQKLDLPGLEWQIKEKLVPLKALRAPREVEFRKGAPVEDVVADILPYNSVKLCAPVGAGKSVKMPAAIAARTKALVFHVVPSRQLATHLFGYLVKVSQQPDSFVRVPVDCYAGDVDSIPRNGVFFLSAAAMVDIMMRNGGLSRFKGCTVFLDEAHESDAYTHVVRSTALQLGAERLVLASATFSPEVHGRRDTPGSVKMIPVDLGPPSDWEVDRSGSPFQMATLQDGILVFVDSRDAAMRLTVAYERLGLDVFRLTATSTDEEVSNAFRAANDKNGVLFAIIADYTYRSGFTFNVSRVVDAGRISYYDSTPGKFVRSSRPMFQFEREQASGRVGRIAGGATYYYQNAECPAVMCDLEGVEKEAAAYIFRCMGFIPEGVLKDAFMAKNDLPDHVSVRAALNGPYPLSYYVLHKGAAEQVPKNENIVKEKVTEAVAPPSYDAIQKSKGPVDEAKPDLKEMRRDSGYGSENNDWDTMVQEFTSPEDRLELRDGIYYISQVRDSKGRGVAATLTFPSGLQSVREFALKRNFKFAVASLRAEDRAWAFSELLDRYNTVTAQIRGARTAAMSVKEGERSPAFVDVIRDILEGLSADHADAVSCLRAAEVFALSPSWVTAYDGELKAEIRAYDQYCETLKRTGSVRGGNDLDADIAANLDYRVDKMHNRNKNRGRIEDKYDGRKHELLLPSWVGGRRIKYDSAVPKEYDRKGKASIMQRGHGHDDDGYVYKITRTYTRYIE